MRNFFGNIGKKQKKPERNLQDGFEWEEDAFYEEAEGYSEAGGYSEEEGYSEAEGYSEEEGYSEAEGYSEEEGYSEAEGYSEEEGYSEAEGYSEEEGYSEAEGYSEEEGYSEAEGYSEEEGYSEAEGYSEEETAGEEWSDYGGEAEYADENSGAETQEYVEEGEYYEEANFSGEIEYNENTEYQEAGGSDEEQELTGGSQGYYEETVYYDEADNGANTQEYSENEEYYENAGYENEIEYNEKAQYKTEKNYDDKALSSAGQTKTSRKTPQKKKRRRANVALMDGMIALSGVAVILLAVVVGLFFYFMQNRSDQYSGFQTLGNQLQGIELIGGKGILAVASAQLEKMNAPSTPQDPVATPEKDPDPGYQENNYTTTVAVAMKLTSVRKDLKIKFSNRETEKLVGNVRFVAEVTKPDGSKEEWTDSDMDGIIYQKDIADGQYMVALKAFEDGKYPNYILPAGSQTVQVKKNIEYASVDVTGEGRKEDEINANLEDTRINNTDVESSLKDTVQWVPSTCTGNTYTEVSRSMIPDPVTLEKADMKQLMSVEAKAKKTPAPTKGPGEDGETGEEEPTPEPAKTPKPTKEPAPEPTRTPKPTEEPAVKLRLSLDEAVLELEVTKAADGSVSPVTGTARASLKGAEPEDVQFSCKSGDESVATATVNERGKVTVTAKGIGSTDIKVTAKCKGASDSQTLEVLVVEKPALTMKLDKTELSGYSGAEDQKLEVRVTVKNSSLSESEITGGNLQFQAETTDANVAKVTKKKITADSDGAFTVKITVAPAKLTEKKSCTLNVSYVEGSESVSAVCAITIRPHPKQDKETKLLDNKNNQLYVFENNVYREAVYADYYTEAKLFVQGGVKYTGWQTIDGKVYFFTADGNYVTGEQVIQGARYTFDENGVLQNGSGVLGIDVSKWNGAIDWKAVKNSGVTFVIIRCGYRGSSQGMMIEDPKFSTNIQGATEAGLKVGVYFFTQAVDEVEAVYEASYVIEKVRNYKLSYPIFLDVEPSGGRGDKIDRDTRTGVCKAFCQTIQNAGYTAGIYANKSWLTEKINAAELSGYKIWLAQYASAPTYTGRYDMWQYKSTGSVSGISGNVDMNLSYMGY